MGGGSVVGCSTMGAATVLTTTVGAAAGAAIVDAGAGGVIRFPEKLEGCSHTGAGLPMSQGYEQRLRMRPISWTSEFQAEQHLPMISLTVR